MSDEFNVETKREGHWVAFNFRCEGCGAEGNLQIQEREIMNRIGCPEKCGAVYIPWKNPLHGARWELMCVVCPVFEEC